MTEEKSFTYDDLYPYQKVGVEFLLSKNGVLLADEMGTGKTVQVASALQKLKKNGELRRGLIVVPASLKINWHNELRRWAPSCGVRLLEGNENERNALYRLPIHLLIASYEQVRPDFSIHPPNIEFDVVVLDEAQRVKDPLSATSVAVSRMNRKRLWALTGTPLENRVEELQNIIQLIRPEAYLTTDKEILLDALYGHFLRRKKSEVFEELGEIVEKTLLLELAPKQRVFYDEIWADRRKFAGAEFSHIFALITQLKKACNFCPETMESSKMEALKEILEASFLEKGKVVIFSQYVETLEQISEMLTFQTEIFHGGLSSEEKEEVLLNFQNRKDFCIMLVSLRAGGVGLNIPEATHIVLFDRWWNPQLENQAIHRAHRLDRKATLLVYKFQVRNSIESRIIELLHEKSNLFDDLVEGAAIESKATGSKLKMLLDI